MEDKTKKPLVTSDLFSKDEIAQFKSQLLEEKEKLLKKSKDMMDSKNIHVDKEEMYDEVDMASVTIEQNLTFKLMDRDRKLLGEINHALNKMDSGDFGFCEGTGEPIPKRRLEVRPWCKYSVKYKELLEKRKKSGRGLSEDETV